MTDLLRLFVAIRKLLFDPLEITNFLLASSIKVKASRIPVLQYDILTCHRQYEMNYITFLILITELEKTNFLIILNFKIWNLLEQFILIFYTFTLIINSFMKILIKLKIHIIYNSFIYIYKFISNITEN